MPATLSAPNKRAALIAVGCCAVLLLCALAGLPLPHNDDLTFAPTGRELAQHGAIWNAQTQRWWPSAPPYYGYPPGGAFLNAGWFTLFGFSTLSLAIQYGVLIVVFAFGWRSLSTRADFASVALTVMATCCFVSATVKAGYRPDAAALALTFAGAGLAIGEARWRLVLGGFLFAWAVVTGPDGIILEAFVVGFVARRMEERKTLTLRTLAYIAAGGAGAVALFMLLIGGRIDLFLAQTAHHAGGALVRENSVFSALLTTHGLLAILVLAAAGGLRFWLRDEPRTAKPLELAMAFGAGLMLTQFLHRSFVYYLFYVLAAGTLMAFALARSERLPKLLRRAAPVGVGLGLLALNFAWLAYAVTPRAPRAAQYAQTRALIEQYTQAGRQVFIDATAARLVYRGLPPNPVQAWEFFTPFPGNLPMRRDDLCEPNAIWVVSPVRTDNLLPGVFADQAPLPESGNALADFFHGRRHHFYFPERAADVAVLECRSGAPALVYASAPDIAVAAPANGAEPTAKP